MDVKFKIFLEVILLLPLGRFPVLLRMRLVIGVSFLLLPLGRFSLAMK
jgi:hypothetical protein